MLLFEFPILFPPLYYRRQYSIVLENLSIFREVFIDKNFQKQNIMGGRTVKFFLRLTRANMTINKLLGIAKAFDWSLAGLNNLTMSEEELMEAVRNARDRAGIKRILGGVKTISRR